jgi:hypothetical protein
MKDHDRLLDDIRDLKKEKKNLKKIVKEASEEDDD